MWKLTVTRTYKREGDNYDYEHFMYFESNDLEELQIIINYFDTIGTGGKFTYTIVKKDGE